VRELALMPEPNPVRFANVTQAIPPLPVSGQAGQFELRAPPTWQLTDVNGDGRADLLSGYEFALGDLRGCSSALQLTEPARVGEVWLNTGAGWQRDPQRSAGVPPFARGLLAARVADSEVDPRRVEFVATADAEDAVERISSKAFESCSFRFSALVTRK